VHYSKNVSESVRGVSLSEKMSCIQQRSMQATVDPRVLGLRHTLWKIKDLQQNKL